MRVTVDKDLCIGCGACVGICPDVFDFDDDGLAYVKNEEKAIKDKYLEKTKEAIENCPTDAIYEK